MSSFTSVELNHIISRYLNESGFKHSAFYFDHEAEIKKWPIDRVVPPGALVKLVQKGLQYKEMEANATNVEDDVDEDFSFLQPMDLITKNVSELKLMLRDAKKNNQGDKGMELQKENEGASCLIKDKEEKKKSRNNLVKQNLARVGKNRGEKSTKRTRKKN